MQVRQLQIAHDALQDRLVLRVATQADEEFRVWLTRRFLRELWPHLAKLLAHSNSSAPLAADIEAMPAPASFEQPFQDDKATYPLGSNPLLTSEIKVDTLSDGGYHLTFREGRERSFELGLTPDLLQAFCAMLRAGAEQAQWGLALDYAAPDPVALRPGHPHSRLH
ncbi:hypothetical protein LZ012_14120 [Dechloromonas sp. XY25]|uniref:Uncharacterized protein n=1 Tax=Dechloromonas hankyongensis TaxID=2908002 RepID=A0ABS9K4N3_9RHOO|nr:hypothetical protein [Dechloromonas hankyongensis]MCG2578127.1 hypothetical protein [Dechloromonas hankyongensis]